MGEFLGEFRDAAGGCLYVVWLLFALAALLWTLSDADERMPRRGCLVTLLVFLTWPWGFVLYLVLRKRLAPLAESANVVSGEAEPM